MPELHGLFDRDVFVKLACCDLWKVTLAVLEITHPYRLASSSLAGCERILRKRDLPKEIAARTSAALVQIVADTPVVPGEWAEAANAIELINRIGQSPGIDVGEALLVAVSLTAPVENCLITGDKRFVASLKTEHQAEFERLEPKLATFEDCLLRVEAAAGFEFVKARAMPAAGCDGTLKVAFGMGAQTTAAMFREVLMAYHPHREGQ